MDKRLNKIILILLFVNTLFGIFHINNYNPSNDDLFYRISVYSAGIYAIIGTSFFLSFSIIKLWELGNELLDKKIEKIVEHKIKLKNDYNDITMRGEHEKPN